MKEKEMKENNKISFYYLGLWIIGFEKIKIL
jgi:hypothetical protein